MNRSSNIEHMLSEWLDTEAELAPPVQLLPDLLAAVAGTRQRPAWWPSLALPRAQAQPALVWLIPLVLLLVAAMAGALVVGGQRPAPASVENGLIAFIGAGEGESDWSADGRGSDVYLVAPDGTGLVRLTETSEVEWGPAWSPDGSRLAFIRELRAGGPPPPGIDCSEDPAACERGTPGRYAVIITDGAPGTERIAFEATGPMNSLAWSPDGRRLSFNHEASGGLMVLDVTSGATRLVLADSVDMPAWSPDGTHLAADRSTVDGAGSDIYLVAVSGREPLRLTTDPGYEFLPAWSPDGGRIAFGHDPDGMGRASRIEVMDADGTRRAIVAEQAYGPAWAPDGLLIAYVRTFGDATGRSNEVWVMAPDGSGQRKLGDEGSRPRWSPDGEVVYWRGEAGTWSTPADGSAPPALLPTAVVPILEGLSDAAWQPLYR